MMRASFKYLCLMLFFGLVCLSPFAQAVQISGTGSRGWFEGFIAYRYHSEGNKATLSIELTNTSPIENGGYLTGFVLNNPAGKISSVSMSDSEFVLMGEPTFGNGIDASPMGFYDIGAAIHGSWKGTNDCSLGIAVGETRTFSFTLSGIGLSDLSDRNFVEERPEGGSHFLAVRFDEFAHGEGETVSAIEVCDPVTIISATAAPSVPNRYSLLPNYPNPFNASTNIEIQLPCDQRISLTIYDVLGRTARHLVDTYQQAGSYTVRWNGKDDGGHVLKSGVYYCVFEAGSYSETIKMVLAR